MAQAKSVFEAFERQRNAADAHLDTRILNRIETGGAKTVDALQYDQIEHRHRVAGGPTHYGSPVHTSGVRIDVPAQGGYPADFLVQGTVKDRTDYTVFTKASASAPWQASYLATLAKGERAPALELHDGFGSAVDVTSSNGLAGSPSSVSTSYAAYLESLGSAHGEFASGPNTTGTVAGLKRSISTNEQHHIKTAFTSTVPAFAPLAFRTADGGALVFFPDQFIATFEATGNAFLVQNNAETNYSPYITPGDWRTISETHLNLWAAVDPPPGGKIDVLGSYGGITYATGTRA